MNHPQPPTPIQVDNSTAVGISNKTIRQRQSKAMDMRFYWITGRINQGQFRVYWRPGPTNRGDYHSKHYPPAHHIAVRPIYLHEKNSERNTLQGCVKSPSRYITVKWHKQYITHKGATRDTQITSKGITRGTPVWRNNRMDNEFTRTGHMWLQQQPPIQTAAYVHQMSVKTNADFGPKHNM